MTKFWVCVQGPESRGLSLEGSVVRCTTRGAEDLLNFAGNTGRMQILSIQPFVPSGADHEQSKRFFVELGFTVEWDAGDYTGFLCNGCRFILQNFSNRDFSENFMLSVAVPDVEALQREVQEKQLTERYDVKFSKILHQPYGKELNLIDLAGVCWHFVAQ